MNKFDASKPVQTRDGRKARIICTNRTWEVVVGSKWPIVALLTNPSGNEELLAFRADGTAVNSQISLVNIPEETKEYYKIFDDGSAGRRKSSKEQLINEIKDNNQGIALLEITKIDGVVTKSEVVYAR